jgi:hypothetical protein
LWVGERWHSGYIRRAAGPSGRDQLNIDTKQKKLSQKFNEIMIKSKRKKEESQRISSHE